MHRESLFGFKRYQPWLKILEMRKKTRPVNLVYLPEIKPQGQNCQIVPFLLKQNHCSSNIWGKLSVNNMKHF